jgi:hypothetical protein
MVGVFVTFAGAGGPDRDRAAKVAHEARGMFEGMPGLRSKVFTYDDAAGRATNFYVWESEEAARGFFTDELRDGVTHLYGVAPTIDFVEVLEVVDNPVG